MTAPQRHDRERVIEVLTRNVNFNVVMACFVLFELVQTMVVFVQVVDLFQDFLDYGDPEADMPDDCSCRATSQTMQCCWTSFAIAVYVCLKYGLVFLLRGAELVALSPREDGDGVASQALSWHFFSIFGLTYGRAFVVVLGSICFGERIYWYTLFSVMVPESKIEFLNDTIFACLVMSIPVSASVPDLLGVVCLLAGFGGVSYWTSYAIICLVMLPISASAGNNESSSILFVVLFLFVTLVLPYVVTVCLRVARLSIQAWRGDADERPVCRDTFRFDGYSWLGPMSLVSPFLFLYDAAFRMPYRNQSTFLHFYDTISCGLFFFRDLPYVLIALFSLVKRPWYMYVTILLATVKLADYSTGFVMWCYRRAVERFCPSHASRGPGCVSRLALRLRSRCGCGSVAEWLERALTPVSNDDDYEEDEYDSELSSDESSDESDSSESSGSDA